MKLAFTISQKENVFISKLFPWICHPIYLPESNKMRKKKKIIFHQSFIALDSIFFFFFVLLFFEGKLCSVAGVFNLIFKNNLFLHESKNRFVEIQFHYKCL